MSGWTHPICDDCWAARNPGREPVRVKLSAESCCWCERLTGGIYTREDPFLVPCGGDHPGDDD